jgi:hypothetical protein
MCLKSLWTHIIQKIENKTEKEEEKEKNDGADPTWASPGRPAQLLHLSIFFLPSIIFLIGLISSLAH